MDSGVALREIPSSVAKRELPDSMSLVAFDPESFQHLRNAHDAFLKEAQP